MADASAYVGRFAPTPSGDLHLGSLFTAAASYLDARAHGGRWLLRLEDIDAPRALSGWGPRIVDTLQRFGFEWDEEIVRQQDRIEHYRGALRRLHARGLTFECNCTRAQLEAPQRYPGTCRDLARPTTADTATRLRVTADPIYFSDDIRGMFRQDLAAVGGDLIIKRRDQIFSYSLAVVVDDALQGVTHVVRGADLLDVTASQVYLQDCLGLPTPRYLHVPVLTEPDGTKLAKSRRSIALDAASPLSQLLSVFCLLGIQAPADLAAATLKHAWEWGIANWSRDNLPKRLNLRLSNSQKNVGQHALP